MPTLRRSDGVLLLGNVSLAEVARDLRFGTPAYVYDVDAIAAEGRELRAAFDQAPHLVAYAVKANSAGPIIKALAVLLVGAVREIEARHVHAGVDQRLERLDGVARGTERADELRASYRHDLRAGSIRRWRREGKPTLALCGAVP